MFLHVLSKFWPSSRPDRPAQALGLTSRQLAGLNKTTRPARSGPAPYFTEAPRPAFGAVAHVAGSKGKGTVCALVGAALEAAGHRVGVVTSPHAVRVEERLRVDGAEVEGGALAARVAEAADAVAEARATDVMPLAAATWFDCFTAAAVATAFDLRCDALVVECGLGGLRDSTNFLAAPVSVVASVELEHVDALGPYFRRADVPPTGRGDAAAATWIVRWERVTPRPRRG